MSWNCSKHRRTLCKQCSEGIPHEHAHGEDAAPEWNPHRTVGIAATSFEEIAAILDRVPGIEKMEVEISLELEAPA
ncbi:hypothetical protein ACN9MZ_27295 [Pseudoduganella sp. S-14]|jgi:hypothetical protein|uniref:hypothetical protein n=1 Tax=Pseudoduganella sp. S-14 TaxID=3404065 RepID=UPI003CFB3D43